MSSRRVLVALLAASLLSVPVQARAGWLRVTSANFVVYSDATPARARAIAERLESFRALLITLFPKAVKDSQAEKLQVIAFKDEPSFRPFKPLYNGRPANIAGAFLEGAGDRSLLAMNASARDSSYRVVFHEYIHKLLSGGDTRPPPWFNEGLAEFYSTAETTGLDARLGNAIEERMRTLSSERWLPLSRLLSIGYVDPEYNEKSMQGNFYAQSWILVHYLTLGAGGKYQQSLRTMVARQSAGVAADRAFAEAFPGQTMEALQRELQAYAGKSSYPVYNMTFKSALPINKAVVENAPASEVHYELGQLLAFSGRYKDASAQYAKARELDAASSLPHEGLGFIAMQTKDIAGAKSHFAEAVKRDSRSHWALYYFALASLSDGSGIGDPAVRRALEKAIAMNPAFVPPYSLLAQVLARANDAKGALRVAQTGLRYDPQNDELRYALATALMTDRQYDQAKVELQKVIRMTEKKELRGFAQKALDSIAAFENNRP